MGGRNVDNLSITIRRVLSCSVLKFARAIAFIYSDAGAPDWYERNARNWAKFVETFHFPIVFVCS